MEFIKIKRLRGAGLKSYWVKCKKLSRNYNNDIYCSNEGPGTLVNLVGLGACRGCIPKPKANMCFFLIQRCYLSG